jgi:uncharacterized membrane protein
MRKSAAFGILVGGSIAGVFDLTYAILFSALHKIPAIKVIQSVASGVLGNAAFDSGLKTALLGVVLHFLIAFSWATIFYLASRKFKFLTQHAILSGILFGAIIYAIMYLIVLPVSAYPIKINFAPSRVAINLIAHMFLIGLPIAVVIRKTSGDDQNKRA